MNKKQIFLIIGIAILLIGVPVGIVLVTRTTGFQLGAKNTNAPENVFASAITSQSASITWTTNSSSQGGVSYGLSADSMTLFKPETGPASSHIINLDNLAAGKTYYYSIKIADQVYDNEGKPYTFSTLPKTSVTTPTVAVDSSPGESGFLSAFGTANSTYDLNKDGIVNSIDLDLFRKI